MDKTDVKKKGVEELLLEKEVIKNKDLTLYQKFKTWISNITVEPVIFCFVMPSVLTMLATQNLNLDKACRVNFNYTDVVCTALRRRKTANFKQEEIHVNELMGTVNAWKEVIHTVVPTILILFLGAWSDKTGRRKICMVIPIIGEFTSCILNLINTYLFYEIPLKWTVLMEVLPISLSGGWYTLFLGTFSYMCDITPKNTRTFRLGLLKLCLDVGFSVGMALSGVILRYVGYYCVYAISATIQFFNLLYVLFFIKDNAWKENKDMKKTSLCTKITSFLKNFFDLQSIRDTRDVIIKKGPNNRRLKLCLILILVGLNFAPIWGEMDIKYLYTRFKFRWDEVRYSIYATYNFVTHTLGTLFAISMFTKKLGFNDATLGIIAAASKICGATMLACATNGKQVFLAPLLAVLDGPSTIAERSMSSKIVNSDELGKINSLLCLLEILMRLIFGPLYSAIFAATLKILPGTVFLLSVGLTVPSLFIFIWFYVQHKKVRKVPKPNINAVLDDMCIPLKESV